MQWSQYQENIFEAVGKTNDSLIIEAVAGSGKTTTIVEAINHVPRNQSVAFLAFNKSIADELKRRITAPNARCMTLHAAGFSAWRKYLGNDSWDCKVNSSKTREIYGEVLDESIRYKLSGGLSKLLGIVKGSGIVPSFPEAGDKESLSVYELWKEEMERKLTSSYDLAARLETYKEASSALNPLQDDDDEVWEDLIEFYDLDVEPNQIINVARVVLMESILRSRELIDYDDMQFMPIVTEAPFDQYDVVFLDEAQDVNNLQIEMVSRMKKPGGRVISVGDRNQAIYGFRGSLSESITSIQKRFNAHSLPLSVSYRCPQNVIKKAQEFVPHIQFHESAPEGSVTHFVDDWSLTNFRPTDVLLCRVKKPLITTAFLLIRNKIPCRVLGRDIGQGLVSLIRKMKSTTIDGLEAKLRQYEVRERVKAKEDESKLAALEDKMSTIQVFIDEVTLRGEVSVEVLVRSIESLFSDDGASRSMFTLSTIHKSKGLEFDRVFILDAQKYMPSKWATQPWQQQQETNLAYVACTRAKTDLFYITGEVLRDVPVKREKETSSMLDTFD